MFENLSFKDVFCKYNKKNTLLCIILFMHLSYVKCYALVMFSNKTREKCVLFGLQLYIEVKAGSFIIQMFFSFFFFSNRSSMKVRFYLLHS